MKTSFNIVGHLRRDRRYRRPNRSFAGAAVVALVIASPCAATALPSAEFTRERAVQLAREGRYETSLILFESLREAEPEDMNVLEDYIVVLGWAECDEKLLDLSRGLDLGSSPAYVIEAVGRALRNQGRYSDSAELYRRSASRFPERWQSRLGLALSLADGKRSDEALEVVLSLANARPENIHVQLGAGYVRRARGEYLESIAHYDRVLESEPRHTGARRLRILSMADLGASSLALSEAEKWPEALTDSDWNRIRGDVAAQYVNWGSLPPRREDPRYQETDRAIELLEHNREATAFEPDARLRARLDRVLALRDRSRMGEVIEEYASLLQEGLDLPFYVLRAVGDAHLYLEKPERAIELYREALDKAPRDFNARRGLFYAFVENEDFERAFEIIDDLAASEPAWRSRDGLKEPRDNNRKLLADLTATLGRAYGALTLDAESRLLEMVEQAPLNADLRQELAAVYRWRGWSRKAMAEYDRASVIEPRLLGSKIGRAHTLLDLGDYETAEPLVLELHEGYPENKHAQRLWQRWERHQQWEVQAYLSTGESSGDQLGTRDIELDTLVFSRPFKQRFRPYFHAKIAEARFPEGKGRYERLGLGGEYLGRGVRFFGEANMAARGDRYPGVDVGLDWNLDDYWSLGARYSSFSTEMPLRGFLRGTTGDRFSLSGRYRSSDLMEVDAFASRLGMTDGNERWIGAATFSRRLRTTPHTKLTSYWRVGASRNTLPGAAYFNPRRDLEASLTLVNDWLGYRRIDRALTHRIAAELGSYGQASFGSAPIATLRYEHDWSFDGDQKLRYGVGWSTRVYDGEREHRIWIYATTGWRF